MNIRKRAQLNRKLILNFGLEAMFWAVGFLFVGLFFIGVDLECCNLAAIVCVYTMISSLIWVILLLRNC